jgi:hypothetical protein
MTVTAILIDPKNPAEALGCYGILCLDHLLERAICRSRFVPGQMEKGLDGEFRSCVFEFEHADGYWDRFLCRCCGLITISDPEGVRVVENGALVLRFDWHQSLKPARQGSRPGRLWLPGGDKNFSPDNVCKAQHDVVRAVAKQACEPRYLFSCPVPGRPSSLTGYNPLNARGFLDAGGVFDNRNPALYASEWFCMIALQGLRYYFEGLREQGQFISYHVWKEWLPGCAAIAAMTGNHSSCEGYRSELLPKNNLLIARLATRA